MSCRFIGSCLFACLPLLGCSSPEDARSADARPIDLVPDAASATACPVIESHTASVRGDGLQVHRICFTNLPASIDCYTSDEQQPDCEDESHVGFAFEIDLGTGIRRLRFLRLDTVYWSAGELAEPGLLELPVGVWMEAIGGLRGETADQLIGPKFRVLTDVIEIEAYYGSALP